METLGCARTCECHSCAATVSDNSGGNAYCWNELPRIGSLAARGLSLLLLTGLLAQQRSPWKPHAFHTWRLASHCRSCPPTVRSSECSIHKSFDANVFAVVAIPCTCTNRARSPSTISQHCCKHCGMSEARVHQPPRAPLLGIVRERALLGINGV